MNIVNFFKNLSPTEIAIIALILIVFFGSKIITNIGRLGGQTFREIKKVKSSFTEAIEDKEKTS